MKTLTLDTLQTLNACQDQLAIVARLCDASGAVAVTRELCASRSQVFDWYWAGGNLLTPVQREAYKGAIALAQKTYDDTRAPADKARNDAMALAHKTYDDATAPAFKAYNAALAGAQKMYDAATALARKTRDDATAPAHNTYVDATTPAQKAYNAATALAQKAYADALAVAFAASYNS